MKAGKAPNIIPRSLTLALLEFCASIAPAEPVFIPSVPIKRAITSFCFDNVAQKVPEKGGSIADGWAIWHMPGLYFEAEHHAVWRNSLGNLIDARRAGEGGRDVGRAAMCGDGYDRRSDLSLGM